jgi:hypothetical protein
VHSDRNALSTYVLTALNLLETEPKHMVHILEDNTVGLVHLHPHPYFPEDPNQFTNDISLVNIHKPQIHFY